jgi:UDP-glucose 4-epimerase
MRASTNNTSGKGDGMAITRRRVLVTGGAGFMGSHLVDALSREHDVIVVDNFSTGRMENLLQHQGNPQVQIEEVDICDLPALERLCARVEVVYHLATQCVRLSLQDPQLVHQVNTTGALNVCQAALKHGVRRLVYVSSSEVYGTAQRVPMDETHPCEPTTVYGASKLTGELYAKAFMRTYGLPIVVVRPFNTYGPRAHFAGVYGEVIPRFLVRVLNGLPPIIYGDGKQSRDFTYVSDTVQGILLAAESEALLGQVVNIARGREVSIRELTRLVPEAADVPVLLPEYAAERPGDVRRHYADITLARKTLGYNPSVSIAEGLRQYVAWFRRAYPDHRKCLDQAEAVNWQIGVNV